MVVNHNNSNMVVHVFVISDFAKKKKGRLSFGVYFEILLVQIDKLHINFAGKK